MRDQQAPSDQGLISGYVLKLTRESLGLTQEGLAEHLDVDKHTLQAWESGRRPLSAIQVFGFVGLRNRLRVLGAAAPLVDTLSAAMEADYVLGYTLGIDADAVDPCSHPLARWVLPRAVSEMIAWAVTGHTPPGLAELVQARRRGPVATGPTLSASQRTTFFEHIRGVAEESVSAETSQPRRVLLRRQAYYQAGWAPEAEMRDWLESMQRREQKAAPWARSGWSPQWVAERSLAVALSRVGDREALWRYLRTGFASEECEVANLHYWAYWLGESTGTHHEDSFMTQDPGPWTGATVAGRLAGNLMSGRSCVDLYIHTLWVLLKRPIGPYLVQTDRALCASVVSRSEKLFDDNVLMPEARRELQEIVGYIGWVRPGLTKRSG
jgi:DNA-binding XRE family transcriptional regulator